jgi:hypothetical protein
VSRGAPRAHRHAPLGTGSHFNLEFIIELNMLTDGDKVVDNFEIERDGLEM